ncbi:MAG: RdgB/HAM1 family non-canonical purine NTP pyrophosphatase [Dehalococcoidia bacterium]|nr:RdgB/HAM1 family non-canonical purine NTP pyrophosphatase [Dehalococcoidia bacterium]
MPRLLLATNNRGKVTEYRALLEDCGWEIVTPAEIGLALEVEESGADYVTNAKIKAQAFAQASGLLSLADDSGLEIDALGGRPGPLSARYAGDAADDEERVRKVLAEMKGIERARRKARFRCVIALAEPSGKVHFAEGVAEGAIAEEPRGERGFGYDPLFLLPEHGRTLAELPLSEKNAVSHRGRAARKACAILKAMLSEQRRD